MRDWTHTNWIDWPKPDGAGLVWWTPSAFSMIVAFQNRMPHLGSLNASSSNTSARVGLIRYPLFGNLAGE